MKSVYLAGKAFRRAIVLNGKNERVIGVSCTATLVSEKEKKGKHRAFISVWVCNSLCGFLVLISIELVTSGSLFMQFVFNERKKEQRRRR